MAQANVIFDLDGTLIESEQIWEDVRRRFVIAQGGRWRDDAQTMMIGMRTAEWARYIHETLAVPLPPNTIARDVVDDVVKRMNAHVPVLPGADDALKRLSRDFRLGLATSASLPVAETVLAHTGWHAFFPVVVSADSVERGKPAPDVYLRAMELLGARSQLTAAVEDSANGIRSAHAAHIAVIAIPNRSFPPDANALSEALRVLPSLNDLNSDVIRSAIDGQALG
ncbi:MAG: HAD family phosphatase [Candidatus Eremiobacteraeota bacterium]|nr:HAD family phosphatase [Candidatus Eremiobacteraeota bacterium]